MKTTTPPLKIPRIEIVEEITKKAPGDRARHTVDCSNFKVVHVGGRNRFVMQEFDCFDGFYTIVRERGDIFAATKKYADAAARHFGLEVTHKVMRQVETVTRKWVETKITEPVE